MLQPYLEAVEHERERSLVFIGDNFSHAFSKPDFHAGSGSADLRPHVPALDELALATRVFASLPEQPIFARIDMVPAADGPILMELELIEPQLAFDLAPAAAVQLAKELVATSRLGEL